MSTISPLTDFTAMAEKAGLAARHLKLLANEKRLLILCCLIETGPMTVGDLVDRVGLSQSALSQHLAKMRADNLVSTTRHGQRVSYSISDPGTAEILSVLYRLYCS